MYDGNNKTAISSQEQLSAALLALMREKDFSSISVSELCKRSGVSRQTYYSLFREKENIILYLLKKGSCCQPSAKTEGSGCQPSAKTEGSCCQPTEKTGKGQAKAQFSFTHICRFYSRYFRENRELMALLVRYDLTYLLYDLIYDGYIASECASLGTTACRNYTAHFLAGGLTGIIKAYILHDYEADEEELYRTISKLFGSGLFGGGEHFIDG